MKATRNRLLVLLAVIAVLAGCFATANAKAPKDTGEGPYNPTGTGYCNQHGQYHTIEV